MEARSRSRLGVVRAYILRAVQLTLTWLAFPLEQVSTSPTWRPVLCRRSHMELQWRQTWQLPTATNDIKKPKLSWHVKWKNKERTINGQGITHRKLPTMQFVFNFDYSSQKELKTILMPNFVGKTLSIMHRPAPYEIRRRTFWKSKCIMRNVKVANLYSLLTGLSVGRVEGGKVLSQPTLFFRFILPGEAWKHHLQSPRIIVFMLLWYSK